jgi:cephalosporin-C deacetylase
VHVDGLHFFEPETGNVIDVARPSGSCRLAGSRPLGRVVGMPLFDLPLAELRTYRTAAVEPPGLTSSGRARWRMRGGGTEVEVEPFGGQAWASRRLDITFSGADGDRVKAWYLRPEEAGEAELPCRITFVGYGGGRDLPAAHALYPACGYATFVMDTRSQGGTWSRGDTADPGAGVSGPEHPGVMTRGIASPENYYYRRLYVDAVRAVETAAELPAWIARASASGREPGRRACSRRRRLAPELVRLCHADVPFLCDIERGMDVAFDPPYTELVTYLAMHPELDERARLTLRHVDNALLASRIEAPTLISVALRDTITPPSTVFAAYNAVRGPKEIVVLPYADHSQVPTSHAERQLLDFATEFRKEP